MGALRELKLKDLLNMPQSDGAAGLRERELRRSGALGAASSKTTRTKGPEAQRHKVRPRKAAKHIEVAPGCLLANLRSKGVTAADTGKRTLLPDSAAHKTEKAPATRSRIRGRGVEGSDSCDVAKESEVLAKPSSFHGEGAAKDERHKRVAWEAAEGGVVLL
ncbi:hypothetical protein AK812_SmicGene1957 [Symbiodinium microadriaticum]|uniref:Uncharacterized protein n=1 Tax=Symbiodinium microadriaticum TaxID=2951 RepID=A0A1Q9F2K2_SYMMI|nr:hypothetical protein AK812_SmicGene1957 [Symbiodinium microadriaticum]